MSTRLFSFMSGEHLDRAGIIPPIPPDVYGALDTHENALQRLNEKLSQLAERLNDVLQPVPMGEKAQEKQPPEGSPVEGSPVAVRIHYQTEMVYYLSAAIEDLLNRLEVFRNSLIVLR